MDMSRCLEKEFYILTCMSSDGLGVSGDRKKAIVWGSSKEFHRSLFLKVFSYLQCLGGLLTVKMQQGFRIRSR